MKPSAIVTKLIDQLVRNLALVITVVVVLVVLIELLNPFNLSFINKAKDILGIDRQSASELQELVAGELTGRQLLADATREYTGDFILEQRGGVLNCAGEKQFINDGIGAARAVVLSEALEYDDGDRVAITIPAATIDSVDLKEDLEIINKRNLCVRLVQIFGDVSSESEVREQLRTEIEAAAINDKELLKEAECRAEQNLKDIFSKTDIDQKSITFTQQSGVSCT